MSRPPLDAAALRRDLLAPAGPLARLAVVDSAPSTNTDLARLVREDPAGWPAPAVLVAEHQVAGRGRAGREWRTPPRAALTASVLLRPALPPSALGWLPLATGLAVCRVLGPLLPRGVEASLKWPNDVLLPAADDAPGLGAHRKVAGVLAEVVPGTPADGDGPAVVVGTGLNVSQTADELPVPTATSLALAGAGGPGGTDGGDRTALLTGLVRELLAALERLERSGGDARAAGLAGEYASRSATLGARVRAELAGGAGVVEGTADRIADDGALVVVTADGERTVGAGDVHHLRAAGTQQPHR